MLASPPLFSVIVVCKNPGPSLADALASIWKQRNAAFELIVVDGASTDGTWTWLSEHRTRLAVLISEPDGGVYDAMNKGLAAASGEWVLFLGADDRFTDESVLAELAVHAAGGNGVVIVGEVVYDDGRIYRLGQRPRAIARNFAHHQAAFYHRSLFLRHGNFDARLGIAADYEFNLRLLDAGIRFVSAPLHVAVCRSGGLSDSGAWRVYAEEISVRHRYFPGWRCWFWDLVSTLRFIRKRLLRWNRTHISSSSRSRSAQPAKSRQDWPRPTAKPEAPRHKR